MQGQWDSPLTARGREQARVSAALLARLGVDRICASPLGRVRETLAIFEETMAAPIIFDDRLKEWSAGLWSGECYADLPDKWPQEFAAWKADRYHCRSPEGENFADLIERARSFFHDHPIGPGTRAAIVAHGFLNRALAAVLLSLTPEQMLAIRQVNNAIVRVVMDHGVYTVDHFVGEDGPYAGLPGEVAQTAESA